MKIIAFSVRNEERKYFKEWEQKNNIYIKLIDEDLSLENVNLIKNYDGLSTFQLKPYDKNLINEMGKIGIKYWSLRNVGIDNIDIPSVIKNNIKLANVPTYSPNAIAEFSILSALRLLRKSKIISKNIQNGNFSWYPNIGIELKELTVGIIGTGHIGQIALNYFKSFGSNIVAYDPYPCEKYKKFYVNNIDELYKKSDIIDIHIPLNEATKNMINKTSINKMKDNVYIINTSRGSIINTDDLISSIENHKIAGAALDTYENEYKIIGHNFKYFQNIPNNNLKKLINYNNVIITPHNAFYTKTSVKNMVFTSLNNIKEFIDDSLNHQNRVC